MKILESECVQNERNRNNNNVQSQGNELVPSGKLKNILHKLNIIMFDNCTC